VTGRSTTELHLVENHSASRQAHKAVIGAKNGSSYTRHQRQVLRKADWLHARGPARGQRRAALIAELREDAYVRLRYSALDPAISLTTSGFDVVVDPRMVLFVDFKDPACCCLRVRCEYPEGQAYHLQAIELIQPYRYPRSMLCPVNGKNCDLLYFRNGVLLLSARRLTWRSQRASSRLTCTSVPPFQPAEHKIVGEGSRFLRRH
jgi:hypothetical protein